ncbi:MAG: type II secretory pathway, prepilin signal peptidase PulO [uncultured bacterium]|uniref:Prepilin peptidase n=1 Tax=Candidatus Woesebacteria bacterium RIFCSPHIGHO2_12_FULL_41_24 TaxID=1802510 RepID=A0A1F8AR01_9BACT|nr:MAG: type II secretory pathway, prepilin signal peptidase PulO [uncultured bacterium]OGM13377.1 MAG: hypothetical protein A2W15_05760 [Candidatus Woesebacteria bacterium RBG_16_41_13]OGM30951.1 MAG: hypothetical protein A2873_04075 [Candidatus Woesebacteria bacterium RIFCSPHIGHO2_01_FULL_42_80]OGM35920.1 MAG: hypothetical protein A3D84_01545 [Candidatus Woesebacteria bacterium RIFCSPHIGHO2_02_FULL_42_20]OGM54187.1 MAG: hypothetical protein A3E44_00710 [Candidatus Woesebacteria bacterium RIFC
MLSIVSVVVFGLVVGSFLSAYTYRQPRGKSIIKGRSVCPRCKSKIAWFDNIPLLSYLLLEGKCRSCKKKISLRYPLIELGTAILFVVALFGSRAVRLNVGWTTLLPDYLFYLVIFILISISISILVIDLEHQIIPDEPVFLALSVTLLLLLFSGYTNVWENLLAGFGSALFLLLLHILTRGRGMGLGDVKLALVGGLILGIPLSAVWMFGSFILGGALAVILLFLGEAHLGQKVAFGPFMIASFFIVLIFGDTIVKSVFPF